MLRPRITEKAYALNAANQYVFEVAKEAHKTVIRRAIEEAFGVNVVDVRCINLPAKKKVFGKKGQVGTRTAVKKAIVTIAEGQSIELFKAGV
jgi:large subunit ribosomal protein L23